MAHSFSAESAAVTDAALPAVVIGGFPTVIATREELADQMAADCARARTKGDSWRPKLVFSSNAQGIALAGKDAEFAKTMAEADLVHADGMPVVWASRLTGHRLPERIVTTDFFHDAAKVAERDGLRFFMLGASDEQNRRAVETISRIYPGLHIVGRHHGYFSEEDDAEICDKITSADTDVLWVAMGKPKQESWAVRNRALLHGVGWVKTCGGLYSFITGDAPRAPLWMQRSGLEWAHRLGHEPRRLLGRYLATNPNAMYRLARHTPRKQRPAVMS